MIYVYLFTVSNFKFSLSGVVDVSVGWRFCLRRLEPSGGKGRRQLRYGAEELVVYMGEQDRGWYGRIWGCATVHCAGPVLLLQHFPRFLLGTEFDTLTANTVPPYITSIWQLFQVLKNAFPAPTRHCKLKPGVN